VYERPTFWRTTKPLRNSISVRWPICVSWPIEGRRSTLKRTMPLDAKPQVRSASLKKRRPAGDA
jgi:hypothetical protein